MGQSQAQNSNFLILPLTFQNPAMSVSDNLVHTFTVKLATAEVCILYSGFLWNFMKLHKNSYQDSSLSLVIQIKSQLFREQSKSTLKDRLSNLSHDLRYTMLYKFLHNFIPDRVYTQYILMLFFSLLPSSKLLRSLQNSCSHTKVNSNAVACNGFY